MTDAALVRRLAGAVPAMTDMLAELVSVESPSTVPEATDACARLLDDLALGLLGARAEWVRRDGRAHLRWQLGGPTRVLLLGHLDTVWPLGTLDRWAFGTDGETATGPGCFDMKAGLVQGLWALAHLPDLTG